jgi:integral membrane sensor domain MASE1
MTVTFLLLLVVTVTAAMTATHLHQPTTAESNQNCRHLSLLVVTTAAMMATCLRQPATEESVSQEKLQRLRKSPNFPVLAGINDEQWEFVEFTLR